MATSSRHPGPHNVSVKVEYDYAGTRYELIFTVDSNSNSGVNMLSFGREKGVSVGTTIRDKWKSTSKMFTVPPDGSGWNCPTVAPPKPIGPAKQNVSEDRLNQHTPICWHDYTCDFWCA